MLIFVFCFKLYPGATQLFSAVSTAIIFLYIWVQVQGQIEDKNLNTNTVHNVCETAIKSMNQVFKSVWIFQTINRILFQNINKTALT